MGAGPDRGLAIERPTLPVNKAFSLLENLPAELLGRRPDVVAARFRVEAATKAIDRAEADFYAIPLGLRRGHRSKQRGLIVHQGVHRNGRYCLQAPP